MLQENIFYISSEDPDDLRRGRLLIILMLGTAILTIFSMMAMFLFLQDGEVQTDQGLLYVGGAVLLAVVGLTWWLARTRSVTISAIIFTIVFAVIVLLDTPIEVVHGRSLFLTVIPILLASLTVRPWAGFAVAIFNGFAINILAYASNIELNIVSALAFLLVALISGLGASSFETLLEELQKINKELDSRVIQRTKEAEDARDEAIQASFAKTEMLAKVSHELRTPMGAILGYTEMIRAGVFGEVTVKQTEMYDVIIERLNVLSKMVDLLLNESRLEFGRIKLNYNQFDPQRLLSNVQFSVTSAAEQKEIDLDIQIAPSAPKSVWGDQDKVEQVLLNLVTNAIKFTDPGGQVSLSVKDSAEKDYWEISVKDTGRGISKEEQEKVFQAFHQINPDSPQEKEGFGLGLSIVRQLLTLMEGSIRLESEIGIGSTFIVSIPNRLEETEGENE